MKIGIFGNSKAIFKKRSYIHFSERVNNYFSDHKVNWYGVTTSSVERLAYTINKNHCDLYIVFHSAIDYVYCPGWPRDFPADILFKANRIATQRFLYYCERYSISLDDNIFENLEFFKNTFYDENRHLNYISNLFLIKSLLVGKKAIHVRSSANEERKVFRSDYFSELLHQSTYVFNNDYDHELVSNIFIQEIEQALNI